MNKVAPLGQEDALSGSRSRGDGANRDYLVLTFHPALSSKIYDILKSLQVVLQADEEHKKLFPLLPLVSFRRAKTLRDILVRSKLSQLFTEPNECTGCNCRNCQVCNFLVKGGTFSNREGTRTFDLRKGTLNCNTKFVVYKLQCKTCHKQYIGSTSTKFQFRFNNYKSQFNAYQRQLEAENHSVKVIPQAHLFSHFLQEGHNGMDDWEFQLIDKSHNLKQVRERESFWQFKLDTFLPKGLNDRTVNA